MHLLLFSDIHFYPSWPEFNPLMPSGMTKWLEIQIDVWRQINTLANELKCDAKLFAGDLVHKRSFIHTTANNSIIDLYKKELQIPEYIIAGNHDRYSPTFNAVQPLNGIGQAVVLDEKSDPVRMLCNSQICNGKQYSVSIQGASPGGAIPEPTPSLDNQIPQFNILLAHGGLSGAVTQSGFELDSGYTIEQFDKFNLVALGDIHAKQEIKNVLIPGAPLQQSWGDSNLECGCWEIEIELNPSGCLQYQTRFHPIRAPKFIYVLQDNLEAVLAIEKDEFNYYDFKIVERLSIEEIKELRRRFPNSYIAPPVVERPTERIVISKHSSDEDILKQFFDHRIKEGSKESFITEGVNYLLKANAKQVSGGRKNWEITHLIAQNFMCFQNIRFDISSLESGVYLISGTTDEETTLTNSIGKSAFITEIFCYTLFDKLARSATRSKDRLIHDPEHVGNAKNLFTEVGLKVDGNGFLVQRFRKHNILGTGCRILVVA